MKNKKNKHWLFYFIFVALSYLVMTKVANIDTLPESTKVQQKIKKPYFESKENEAIKKLRKTKLATQTKKNTQKAINTPFQVTSKYTEQHFFDDNLCNLDNERVNFKPELQKAIKRLDSEYKHYFYHVSDYLKLNVYSTNMNDYFQDQLIQRIQIIHQKYIEMLGSSAKKAITFNIVIAPNRTTYQELISFYSVKTTTSLGVYFGGLNIAFVDYQNSDNKALKTAIHESTHIFNAHLIGRTSNMFNEGMAELFEDVIINKGKGELIISEKRLSIEALPLMQFFDDEQWESLDLPHLYYSSWAWVTFMHSKDYRLKHLIYYMKKEQLNPCSAFSGAESYTIFQEVFSVLETEFIAWQDEIRTFWQAYEQNKKR